MKLTQKDREFLERLGPLLEEKGLYIDLVVSDWPRLVLRKNYGDRIERIFGLSRQGVRWRFNRVFNEMYIQAYISILWVESRFGTGLRDKAMIIARDRVRRAHEARRPDGVEKE